MESFKVKTKIGEDGILRVEMPSEAKNVELEVLIIFETVNNQELQPKTTHGWHPDFFEKVIGGWQGEPLVRGEQGEYEIREELL